LMRNVSDTQEETHQIVYISEKRKLRKAEDLSKQLRY